MLCIILVICIQNVINSYPNLICDGDFENYIFNDI
jgi:hypothetical protein